MANELKALSKMEYPGRVIIVGKNGNGDNVVMYAITGRSPSSQARRLEVDGERKHVYVKPTDEETLKTGQPDLLVYSAIMCENGVVVGNGKQTTDINASLAKEKDPAQVLVEGQLKWQYEPDEPNYTPRISGCITDKGAAVSVLKRGADGGAVKNYLGVSVAAGKGKMIATYTGVNEKPLPSFTGEPLDVDIPWANAEECAAAMYEALSPDEGKPDFRVSAACATVDAGGTVSFAVKNRHK